MMEMQSSFIIMIAVVIVITFIMAIGALTTAVITLRRAKRTQATLDIIFEGKKAKDLEDVIVHNNIKLTNFDTEIQELFNISNTINTQSNKGLHKIGLVRFNPFQDYTGNQSFALALLNSKKNGLILSSIHTREGTRIYVKEIHNGAPVNNELTNEEQTAISKAK